MDTKTNRTVRKHKFKRMRGFVYMVMAKCELCGLQREGTKGNYTYLTKTHINPVNSKAVRTIHVDTEPDCIDYDGQNKDYDK